MEPVSVSQVQVSPSGKIINGNDGLTVLRYPIKKGSSSRVRVLAPPHRSFSSSTKSVDLDRNDNKIISKPMNLPTQRSSRGLISHSKSHKSLSKKKSKTPSTSSHHHRKSNTSSHHIRKSKKHSHSPRSYDTNTSSSASRKHSRKSITRNHSATAYLATSSRTRVDSTRLKGTTDHEITAPRKVGSSKSVIWKKSNKNLDLGSRRSSTLTSQNLELRCAKFSKSKKIPQSNRSDKYNMTESKMELTAPQPEPPFFSVVTPDFYARLKQVAVENPANVLFELKQSRKNQIPKLQTLTSIQEKGRPKIPKGQLSYAHAREALSLKPPPPLPNPTERPDSDDSPSPPSKPQNLTKSAESRSEYQKATSNHTSSGILCHGVNCGAKKQLRFAESTKVLPFEPSPSNSNNTRRLSCNVAGGCMK